MLLWAFIYASRRLDYLNQNIDSMDSSFVQSSLCHSRKCPQQYQSCVRAISFTISSKSFITVSNAIKSINLTMAQIANDIMDCINVFVKFTAILMIFYLGCYCYQILYFGKNKVTFIIDIFFGYVDFFKTIWSFYLQKIL